ncbi:MAG: hypothetical protein J5517_09755 [Eubacterium sp.]|nr:hypothetical protein [Eubacterium sp.]
MDENSNKKTPLLIRFIDKTDPFFSVFWIIWALEMVCMSIFVDYKYFCITIPYFVVVICGIIIAVLAVLIRQNYIKDREDSKGRAVFIIWNAIGPLIYNIIIFPFIESKLYNYNGLMFGGLSQYFVRGFNIGLAILFLIVWFVANIISNRISDRMWKKGIEPNPNIAKNVNRVLGIITLLAIIYLIIYWGVGYLF